MEKEKKRFKLKTAHFFALIFVAVLLYFGIFSCIGWADTVAQLDESSQYDNMTRREKIEYAFSENFHDANYFRNGIAVLYNLLGNRMMNDVYRDDDNRLYNLAEFDTAEANYAEMKLSMSSTLQLYEYCRKNGIPFLYVSYPYKTSQLSGKLPPGCKDYAAENEDLRIAVYQEAGVPVLDLRETVTDMNFYRTDHHWDILTSFNVAAAVADKVKTEFAIDLDPDGVYSDIDNYYDYNFYDCFLGSEGIRTSAYYAGKDDFILYIPKFATDNYLALMDGNNVKEDHSGTFLEAYIDVPQLYDVYYNNKFNSLLFGAKSECLMYNYFNADRSLKALFISDSYGCPVSMYLSQYFYEFAYIDPSEGRYTGNFTRYMVENTPQVVIVMYDSTVPTLNMDIYK